MAALHVKSDDRREQEQHVLSTFGVTRNATAEQRDAAEVIAARTREIMKGGNHERKYW